MMNPGAIMKLMNAKNRFVAAHPKFASFFNYFMSSGIQEGTIIEVTITKPGENPVTSNMKVTASDLELVNELKNLK